MDVSWQRKFISFLLFFPFRLKIITRKGIPKNVKSILLIQWDYLGDIILSTPAFSLLREIYPNTDIVLLTSPQNRGYIDNFPLVNRMFYFNNPLHFGRLKFSLKKLFELIKTISKKRYDLVIELTGRLPNQILLAFIKTNYVIGLDPANSCYLLDKRVISKSKNQLDVNLDVIKAITHVNYHGFEPILWNPCTQKDFEVVRNTLTSKGICCSDYIIMHTVASWKPKCWPIENWVEVIRYLLENNKTVILIGASNEYEGIEQIVSQLKNKNCFNLAGFFNIRQLIALMEKGALFIGNDSGPVHLAAVSKIRSIVLFGPSDPLRWGHKNHTIIYKKQNCSPCPQFAFKKNCIKDLSICKGLQEINPQDVINECKKLGMR